MKKSKLPKTNSIQELAEFWDTHDLTDFEDALEEAAEPVFVRGAAIKVPLESGEVDAVEQMAQAKGVSREELVRTWVVQKLTRPDKRRPTKRGGCDRGGGFPGGSRGGSARVPSAKNRRGLEDAKEDRTVAGARRRGQHLEESPAPDLRGSRSRVWLMSGLRQGEDPPVVNGCQLAITTSPRRPGRGQPHSGLKA